MPSTSIDYIQTVLNCWNSFFWPIVFREIKSEGLTEGTQKTREFETKTKEQNSIVTSTQLKWQLEIMAVSARRKRKRRRKKIEQLQNVTLNENEMILIIPWDRERRREKLMRSIRDDYSREFRVR